MKRFKCFDVIIKYEALKAGSEQPKALLSPQIMSDDGIVFVFLEVI